VTRIEPCAHDCEPVTSLIRDLARAKGTTEQTERVCQGLHSVPDKSGTLLARTQPARLVPDEVAGWEQPIERPGGTP
jgi:hypothetical protein